MLSPRTLISVRPEEPPSVGGVSKGVLAGKSRVVVPREHASHHALIALLLLVITPPAVHAEVGRSASVRDGSGSVSDGRRSVQPSHGSVRGDARSVHEGSAPLRRANPVRDGSSGPVTSGPVSEMSLGPVTEHQGVIGNGGVGAGSAGAVTKDLDSPLGEMIADPVRDLSRLHEQLRNLQPLSPDGPDVGGNEDVPAMLDDADGMWDGGEADDAGADQQ